MLRPEAEGDVESDLTAVRLGRLAQCNVQRYGDSSYFYLQVGHCPARSPQHSQVQIMYFPQQPLRH